METLKEWSRKNIDRREIWKKTAILIALFSLSMALLVISISCEMLYLLLAAFVLFFLAAVYSYSNRDYFESTGARALAGIINGDIKAPKRMGFSMYFIRKFGVSRGLRIAYLLLFIVSFFAYVAILKMMDSLDLGGVFSFLLVIYLMYRRQIRIIEKTEMLAEAEEDE